ncbi:Gfo/Idh/MocA family protein [Dinghuibacter silviterrae]|uniref:Putative dehydrogenase n=1 Tax=Dinghuibacter silviterrae TaxID=1539049 RepID=A0A4R8DV25_9BACT|nr:Gfo/Idh/MocA family oxidoreductase [Dinghuibacter silviterrae]TDX01768.1 putative dehydrogenase [Dinghuibacter silviterrae]
MVKVAVIGAGKMGISHLSILGAHPDVTLVGVCDTSKMVTDFLQKYSGVPCYADYKKMVAEAKPEAVFVAVPTKFHYAMIKDILDQGIHVFGEKPLCLSPQEGKELASLAERKKLVNQVGYHNKFIGTFREVKQLLGEKAIGEPYHFTAEAYGPVVTVRKKATWRSDPKEGGGCLLDYASHVIDLVNDLLGPVERVKSSLLKSIYSEDVEDSVYSLLELRSGLSGVLSVNWSDDTYRKMSTSITIQGTKGKIISDANELKVFFREADCPPGYSKGWNVKNLTDFQENVAFYLRGEEYSSQIDYFIDAVQGKVPNVINNFHSAWLTDHAISLIRNTAN